MFFKSYTEYKITSLKIDISDYRPSDLEFRFIINFFKEHKEIFDLKRIYIVVDNYSRYTRITLPIILQQLEMETSILNDNTEIEVNQIRIGAIIYDPLHPESWQECVDNFLDVIRTMRIVFFVWLPYTIYDFFAQIA